MRLKPVNDKIVVRELSKKEAETTESGIILPDTVDQGRLREGEIIAVGEGMYSANGVKIPVVVQVGDIILYNKHAQVQEYKLNDDDVVIMSQNEILSVLYED